MSLPEILFLLERAEYRRSVELMAQTRSRYLASGAKWSDQYRKDLAAFVADLMAIVEPTDAAPARASKSDLMQLFGAIGIRPES